MNNRRILFIRSGPYEVSFENYNLQEVGLGRAFCNLGYDFDILYYTKGKNRVQIIDTPNNTLRILWTHGHKVLRTGLYFQYLKKSILQQYDVVILTEYSQLMSVLVSRRHDKTYLYNGQYYNLFKIPFLERIYDALFCKELQKRMNGVFCKSQMAKKFLADKGITNSCVVGVGLDSGKYSVEQFTEGETQKLLDVMEGKFNFLYVGQIIPRKNVELLINAFIEVKQNNNAAQLVLIGSGDKDYKKRCESLIPNEIQKDVVWCPFIKNAQLKYIYQKADVFLLPSVYEIFGMVLLESMFFGLPVISSHSAGADTLIENNRNGIIVEDFEKNTWVQAMNRLVNDGLLRRELGESAQKTVQQKFMWQEIAGMMLGEIEKQ